MKLKWLSVKPHHQKRSRQNSSQKLLKKITYLEDQHEEQRKFKIRKKNNNRRSVLTFCDHIARAVHRKRGRMALTYEEKNDGAILKISRWLN